MRRGKSADTCCPVLGRRYRGSELSEANCYSSMMEIIGASAITTASRIDSHDEDSTDKMLSISSE